MVTFDKCEILLAAQRKVTTFLIGHLMLKKAHPDVDVVKERLSWLLIVLQRDGYLLESSGRYSYRSFLLRNYWHRRRGL
jgi:hypothetical protein